MVTLINCSAISMATLLYENKTGLPHADNEFGMSFGVGIVELGASVELWQNGAGLMETREHQRNRGVSAFSPPEQVDGWFFFRRLRR
jgi:hypothetical protein